MLDLVEIAAKNEFEEELAEGLEPTHIKFPHYYSNSSLTTSSKPNPNPAKVGFKLHPL